MKRQRLLHLAPVALATALVLGTLFPSGDTAEAQQSARTDSSLSRTVFRDPDGMAAIVLESTRASVQPDVSLDRSKVVAHTSEELFVLVHFEIPEPIHVERKRPPLDLALVIDRSGSMSERGKITHAREASCRLIDAMGSSDILGIVEYDDEVTVLWPSGPVSSPQMLKNLIQRLGPRGSTNLAGGLLRGIDENRRHSNPEGINRVFLFSDGLANHGITSPYEIARLVRHARAEGISVSTLGLGLEYNEDLMQTIAEAGGGNYYYVESPSQMASIFERELSTLFATVAKDVHLRFDFGPAVRTAEAIGYDGVAESGSVTIPLENLYGGEERSVLLRLQVDPQIPGPVILGKLQLRYTDFESNSREALTYRLRAEATVDSASVQASVNDVVSAESTLMTAEEEHEQAVRDYERGEKDLAKSNLAALSARIEHANSVFQDDRLSKKLEQLQMEAGDMDRADLNEENRQMYLKGSKERLYNAQKGKRGQYMLQEHDSGFEVEKLQTRLQELQLYAGPVDGVFDEEVRTAVERFQEQNGLDRDGIAGPATLRGLSLY